MNTRKMYFFDHNKSSNLTVIILLLRIIGCLIIGQKILAISNDGKGSIKIYMYYR